MHGHSAVPGRRGSPEREHAPKRQTAGLGGRPGPPDQHQKPRNRPGLRRRRLPLAPLLRHAECQGDRGAARRTDAPHLAQGRHDHADLRPPERHRFQRPRSGETRHAPHARHHARRRRGAFRIEDREPRAPTRSSANCTTRWWATCRFPETTSCCSPTPAASCTTTPRE